MAQFFWYAQKLPNSGNNAIHGHHAPFPKLYPIVGQIFTNSSSQKARLYDLSYP